MGGPGLFEGISFFEAIMLVCFGLAWPLNIIKSLRTKSTKGKSVFFLIVILVGYVAGITHKILYSRNIVLVLYCINFIMVSIDTSLYFYYRHKERLAEKQACTEVGV